MKFTDFPYQRIDIDEASKNFKQYAKKLKYTSNLNEAMNIINSIQQLQSSIETTSSLAYIRYSINTKDNFYKQEVEFWDQNLPHYSDWNNEYYNALLESPIRSDLEENIPSTLFQIAELSQKTFNRIIIPLLQEENRLSTKYNHLIASAEFNYKGNIYNLSEMSKFSQSIHRSERKEVQTLISNFFSENEDVLDTLYDDLVKVRHEMAQKLGYKDYVELGYDLMMRLDYSRKEIELYRKNIVEDIVPLVGKIYDLQANRIGIDQLKYYDLSLKFKDGNATPKGDVEKLMSIATEMYHEMSPETAEFIDFINAHQLMDLASRPGKQSGGYCNYLSEFKSPFIFANFNGTSGDVDVLTHEVGHAFQVYESRWIDAPEIIWPTYESCEIHSMSMEFFAWPWMKNFFKEDTEKYKYTHLTEAIIFLPYGVLVDHFQHEVYSNPSMTPLERRKKWRELEKMYQPWKKYDGNQQLEDGGYWFRQGHIFTSPFYYIDYTLAQVCALQFWQRRIIENDDSAWTDYLNICRVGGTKSFLEIVDLANLKSPFEDGFLKQVIKTVEKYIDDHASQFDDN